MKLHTYISKTCFGRIETWSIGVECPPKWDYESQIDLGSEYSRHDKMCKFRYRIFFYQFPFSPDKYALWFPLCRCPPRGLVHLFDLQ